MMGKGSTVLRIALLIAFAMAAGPALAHDDRVECPCGFAHALAFAQKQAAELGASFSIDECTQTVDGITAESASPESIVTGDCRIEFEVEAEDDGFECGYELQCGFIECNGDEIDAEGNSLALALDIEDLTEAQFLACILQVRNISQNTFGTPCYVD